MAAFELHGAGRVMCAPTLKDITRAHAILTQFKNDWLEPIWLGCSIDRYMEIKSWDDMLAWVDENDSHANSDLGLLIRAGQEFGLDQFGQGVGKFLTTGTYLHKDHYNNPTIEGRNKALICPSGFYDGENWHEFDHLKSANMSSIRGMTTKKTVCIRGTSRFRHPLNPRL